MKKRKKYTEEFKRDAVRLMVNRGTRTVEEVAKGIGVGPSMLHRWHQLYGQAVAAGQRRAETSQGTDDAEALRRRVRQLEQENALLKKAAAFFAKENL
jgi:transposase